MKPQTAELFAFLARHPDRGDWHACLWIVGTPTSWIVGTWA